MKETKVQQNGLLILMVMILAKFLNENSVLSTSSVAVQHCEDLDEMCSP